MHWPRRATLTPTREVIIDSNNTMRLLMCCPSLISRKSTTRQLRLVQLGRLRKAAHTQTLIQDTSALRHTLRGSPVVTRLTMPTHTERSPRTLGNRLIKTQIETTLPTGGDTINKMTSNRNPCGRTKTTNGNSHNRCSEPNKKPVSNNAAPPLPPATTATTSVAT